MFDTLFTADTIAEDRNISKERIATEAVKLFSKNGKEYRLLDYIAHMNGTDYMLNKGKQHGIFKINIKKRMKMKIRLLPMSKTQFEKTEDVIVAFQYDGKIVGSAIMVNSSSVSLAQNGVEYTGYFVLKIEYRMPKIDKTGTPIHGEY